MNFERDIGKLWRDSFHLAHSLVLLGNQFQVFFLDEFIGESLIIQIR